MKKIFALLAMILCVAVFVPVNAYAAAYQMSDTDMTVSVDDTMWYVFTRDNIKDNAELDELGISYDTMHDILYSNEAYMDAILYYEDGTYLEMFVRKRPLNTGVANLSNYADREVQEFAEALAKKQGVKTYSVYENQYKFAKLEYVDTNYGYCLCEFVTIVNKDNYTITFQSPAELADYDYNQIKNIVDSIRFDVDTSLKDKKPSSVLGKTLGGAAVGAVTGGVIAVVAALTRSKKQKKYGPGVDEAAEDTTTVE